MSIFTLLQLSGYLSLYAYNVVYHMNNHYTSSESVPNFKHSCLLTNFQLLHVKECT